MLIVHKPKENAVVTKKEEFTQQPTQEGYGSDSSSEQPPNFECKSSKPKPLPLQLPSRKKESFVDYTIRQLNPRYQKRALGLVTGLLAQAQFGLSDFGEVSLSGKVVGPLDKCLQFALSGRTKRTKTTGLHEFLNFVRLKGLGRFIANDTDGGLVVPTVTVPKGSVIGVAVDPTESAVRQVQQAGDHAAYETRKAEIASELSPEKESRHSKFWYVLV